MDRPALVAAQETQSFRALFPSLQATISSTIHATTAAAPTTDPSTCNVCPATRAAPAALKEPPTAHPVLQVSVSTETTATTAANRDSSATPMANASLVRLVVSPALLQLIAKPVS